MLKGTRKPRFLEELPAEDPSTKTLNYVKTNGNHIYQEERSEYDHVLPNGYQNGAVVNAVDPHTTERGLRSTTHTQNAPLDFKPPADTSQLQAQGTRKRKPRKSELGGHLGIGNYEVKTRLRTRKSQAGL